MIPRFARAAACALMFAAASVSAQDLTVGLSTPITTLDPHFHNLSPNNAMVRHVFETLIKTDEAQRHKPGLARGDFGRGRW